MVGFVVVGFEGSGVYLGQGTGVGTGWKWGLAGGDGQVRSVAEKSQKACYKAIKVDITNQIVEKVILLFNAGKEIVL